MLSVLKCVNRSEDFRVATFSTQHSDDNEPTEASSSFQYEPTQIDEPTQPNSDTGYEAGVESAGQDQTGASAPLGILSMVNPAKRWRFLGGTKRGAPEPAETELKDDIVLDTSPAPETQSDVPDTSGEPTQPAYEIRPNPRRQLLAKPSALTSSIVPDSEAPPLSNYQNLYASPLPSNEAIRRAEPRDEGMGDVSSALLPIAEVSSQPAEDWRGSEPCEMDDLPDSHTEKINVSHPRRQQGIASAVDKDQDVTEDEDVVQEKPKASESMREEEEESEDDVPLAVQPKRRKVARRRSTAQMPPPKAPVKRKCRGTIENGSSETIIVPSSVPQQDLTRSLEVGDKDDHEAAQGSTSGVPSTIVTPADSPARESFSLSPLTPTDTAISGDLALDKCEETTEPAEDDEPDPAPKATRKRKRATSSTKVNLRQSTKQSRAVSATPLPPTKKLKMSSSTSRSILSEATRVFALWQGSGEQAYYSGTVHRASVSAPARYLVKFDDETECEVDVVHMRRCELVTGDSVLHNHLNDGHRKARVIEVSGDRFSAQISGFDVPGEYQVSDIRISTATVRNDWNGRKLTNDQIVPSIRPKSLAETPSRASLTSGGSVVKGGKYKMLSGIGLVVTLSPSNDEWESRKHKVMGAIKSKGGVVLEDWGDIFNMDGKVEKSGKRWVVRKEDVTLRRNLENVFLISDAPHQKPKYLIALALGIPCVSVDWLTDEVFANDVCFLTPELALMFSQQVETNTWQPHLLAAGFNVQLHYRMSQLVNLDWGEEDRHLERIMYSVAPVKVFSDKNILVISPDFMPQVKGGRKVRCWIAPAECWPKLTIFHRGKPTLCSRRKPIEWFQKLFCVWVHPK